MNVATQRELTRLLSSACDDSIDAEEAIRLNSILGDDTEARAFYVEFMQLHGSLALQAGSGGNRLDVDRFAVRPADSGYFWQRTWQKLHNATSLSLILAGLFVAVVVLSLAVVTLPVMLGPADDGAARPRFVARLMQVDHAEWSEATGPLSENIVDLAAGQPLELLSGFAKLQFDSGAQVLLEGPASVTIDGKNRMSLARGRLVALAPEAAAGFEIVTPAVVVTDLGTEFAVEVAPDDSGRVEVFDGLVEVAPRDASTNARRVRMGQAVLFSPTGRTTLGVSPAKSRFARSMPGETRRKIVSLAAALVDENGRPVGISLENGELQSEHRSGCRATSFQPVPALDWIDGVFIPHSGPEQVITSTGIHSPIDFQANGITHDDLWNGPNAGVHDNVLDGVNYALTQHRMLGMHANKGITFDLDAVRRSYPGWSITQFRALAGNNRGVVRFYLFVDGNLRQEILDHDASLEGVPLQVALDEGDRFLTIVAAQSGPSVNYGWAIVADPRLHLEIAPLN